MKKIMIFLGLAFALFFNGCQDNRASLPRTLTEDPNHNAASRHNADPITRAITLDPSDPYAYLVVEDWALDGYPIISYYKGDNSLTTILAVVIDHSGTSCYGGLVRVDNLRVSKNSSWSPDLDGRDIKKVHKPKIMAKTTTKPVPLTSSSSSIPTPRRPRPPFRVKDGYSVCEIVPNPNGWSYGGDIYDQIGYEY